MSFSSEPRDPIPWYSANDTSSPELWWQIRHPQNQLRSWSDGPCTHAINTVLFPKVNICDTFLKYNKYLPIFCWSTLISSLYQCCVPNWMTSFSNATQSIWCYIPSCWFHRPVNGMLLTYQESPSLVTSSVIIGRSVSFHMKGRFSRKQGVQNASKWPKIYRRVQFGYSLYYFGTWIIAGSFVE